MGNNSKAITSVKENFKSLLDTLSIKRHISRRSSKKREIEVSWPQNVIKTVEAGEPIRRTIAIRNQAERILPQESSNNAPVPLERIEPAFRPETIDIANEEATSPEEEIVPAPAVDFSSKTTPVDVNQGGLQEENRVSINTASVEEWMSEPRTSWRQSAPPVKATVSKLRLIKPQFRTIGLISPRSNPAEIQHQDATDKVPQNGDRLAINRPSQNDLNPTFAGPDSHNNDPSFRAALPPTRNSFVVPHPIAVKRDSWRYSVDAALSCDKERTQNRYSLPGVGFSDLLQPKEIRDPETSEKIIKLRQNKVDLTGNAEQFEQWHTVAEPGNKVRQPRQFTRPSRGQKHPTRQNVVNISPYNEPSKSLGVSDPPMPSPDPASHTVETRPSTVSSNVRTPKQYYGLNHDIVDRIQVKVYPNETKAEYTERGRNAVLDRWVDRGRLIERRKESRGIEKKDREGVLWRTADILLGKASYAPGPAIVHEVPIRAPKVPPVFQPTNVLREQHLPPPQSRLFKLQQPLPPPPQNSPVESSFSDLLSTSRYPQRMPGSAQHFPPAPSHAIVPYSTSTSPDTQPSSRTVTPRNIFSSVPRQPGPWDILDIIHSVQTALISDAMARELLFKYVRRPLHPAHSQSRDRRLAESHLFFTMEPPRNFIFNDLKDTIAYVLESRNAVQREGFSQELTTLNRVNLLRLIISKEFIPYPLVCKEIFSTLQLFRCAWPVGEALGLRPFGLLHFMHEDAEIMTFLSTEDDALYLWSGAWDERVFGARRLVRAATTLDDCERGILNGLHVLSFEQGGWLKIEGYDDETIEELNAEMAAEEDIYGYEDWTKGLNIQM